MVNWPYVPVKADPIEPAVPEFSEDPTLIAVTVRDALASASLSEFDEELVSSTSPVFSPVISTKLNGLESEKEKILFEPVWPINALVPSLLNTTSFGDETVPVISNAPLYEAVDKLKPVLRSYSKISSLFWPVINNFVPVELNERPLGVVSLELKSKLLLVYDIVVVSKAVEREYS